jgi:hypothetical protein
MQSSRTSVSRFRSRTEGRCAGLTDALAVVALLLGAIGCDEDEPIVCGPEDAPASGIFASTPTVLEFGNLVGGANNDCPGDGAPSGVISLTLQGVQTGGGGGFFTLCIERPDLLAGGAQDLGLDRKGSPVHVVDVTASADGCTYELADEPPTGGVSATGLCGNGTDPRGFAITIGGNITLTQTCGAAVQALAVDLSGRVAVSAQ